jgi:hypothetical protein
MHACRPRLGMSPSGALVTAMHNTISRQNSLKHELSVHSVVTHTTNLCIRTRMWHSLFFSWNAKKASGGAYTKERSISDISATGGVKQQLFSHELDLPVMSANQHIIGHIGIIIKSKNALLEVIGESKRE